MKVVGVRLLVCGLLLAGIASAQETRSAIFGRVLDPQSAAVPGAAVTVTNVETNTIVRVKTNDTGYYEASLLMPGNYRVSAEAAGFKTTVQKDVALPVSTRREVVIQLEVGTLTDSVTVEAGAVIDRNR